MAKKKASAGPKFDLMKFLLEKGDRIGLIVAGVALAALALLGIMAASNAASPGTMANELQTGIQSIDQQLVHSPDTVTPIDMPETAVYKKIDVTQYKTSNPWFGTYGTIDQKRVNPQILALSEGRATFVIGGYGAFDVQGDNVAVLENRKVAENQANRIKPLKRRVGQNVPPGGIPNPPQPPGIAPPGIAPPAAGGPPVGGRPPAGGRPGMEQNSRATENELRYVAIESKEAESMAWAIDLRPIRMVWVKGLVPYKAQVEKYLRALRLDTDAALESDGSAPSYKGIVVERKVIGPDGKESDWATFDHIAAYRTIRQVAADFEKEDDKYLDFQPSKEHRLYLARPKLIRGAYGPVNLAQLGQALDELNKSGQPKVLTPKAAKAKGEDDVFDTPDSTPNAPTTGSGYPGGTGGRPLPGMAPPGGGRPLPGGDFRPGVTMGAQAPRNSTVPVWLMQFLDPTVEPGYSYRYRVMLKAQNPNQGRKEQVAFPGLASVEELQSEWFEIPDVVSIPPEEFLFAQGDKYKDKKAIGSADYDTTILKFHRWFTSTRIDESSPREYPVGDWVIADIEAKRGQYVHQKKPFKLPIWSMPAGGYIFRDRISLTGKPPKAADRDKNVTVDFTPTVPVLLVDFEGGKGSYTLPNNQNVADECVAEVLLVSDDGKALRVFSRNAALDKEIPDRKVREESWERWLAEVTAGINNIFNQPNAPPGARPSGPGG